ncbi:MAG: hypothetical protein K0S07_1568 [Chlamydiales bacterium]|nr:hypothetical protein [Chlamydiales bacterium]
MEQNLGTDRNHLSHRVIKWSPVAAAAFASSLFVPPLVSVVIAVSAIALVLFSTKHNFKEMYALSGAICLLGFAVEAFKFAANPGAASIGSVAAPALFAAWSLYCAR